MRGHVSPRTDAFAFGLMAIELLTGLHILLAREVVDDCESTQEIGDAIQQHHDGTIAEPRATGLPHLPTTRKCKWPAEHLGRMALIAAKCARTQVKRRAAISEVLPQLEELVPSA